MKILMVCLLPHQALKICCYIHSNAIFIPGTESCKYCQTILQIHSQPSLPYFLTKRIHPELTSNVGISILKWKSFSSEKFSPVIFKWYFSFHFLYSFNLIKYWTSWISLLCLIFVLFLSYFIFLLLHFLWYVFNFILQSSNSYWIFHCYVFNL
jgi:hypothetical protein